MSEEKGSSSANMNHLNCISESVATENTELPFRCPACGGEQLSCGIKSYQKAVIMEDGDMDVYGGDSVNEDQTDFMCWGCCFIICTNGEPIRRVEDMVEWLKAHSPGEKG